ncbi:hypothetical protein M2158_004046 [Streptomyces sp. SAI-144]|uniref:hypothetical protein n=1 Tax=Streptomyces sp. SAI-144 TaxID=2940544 RepID=UPI002475FE72|nr:hypothetical protein [Streptomyces sp. SAI-144]MDH6435569.1 hypothetical protein [Streptomyces sp. SAI-144]
MESPRGPRVWYFFSDDVPECELIVPIKSDHGLCFAVRPNAGMDQKMLDRLNEAADHVLGVGLAHLDIGRNDKPPERKE